MIFVWLWQSRVDQCARAALIFKFYIFLLFKFLCIIFLIFILIYFLYILYLFIFIWLWQSRVEQYVRAALCLHRKSIAICSSDAVAYSIQLFPLVMYCNGQCGIVDTLVHMDQRIHNVYKIYKLYWSMLVTWKPKKIQNTWTVESYTQTCVCNSRCYIK